MRLFLFVAAVVSLGLAGWNFNAVIDELRRSLPPQFNELDLRRAVGIHIWTTCGVGRSSSAVCLVQFVGLGQLLSSFPPALPTCNG
jgi:hypothetical protein